MEWSLLGILQHYTFTRAASDASQKKLRSRWKKHEKKKRVDKRKKAENRYFYLKKKLKSKKAILCFK